MSDDGRIDAVAKAMYEYGAGHTWDQVAEVWREPYRLRATAALAAADADNQTWLANAYNAGYRAALAENDIDTALDNPDVVAALGREYARRRNGEADYDSRPSYKSYCDGNAVAEVESALITVREAMDACRKAKEQS